MFQLREAATYDGAAIVKLVNSVYRAPEGLKSWTTEATFIDGPRVDESMFQEMINAPGSSILVAEDSDRADAGLAGCVHLQSHRYGEECHLGMLSVGVPWQKLGLGSRLVTFAEEFARHRFGALTMTMHVITIRTELMAWYERRGYIRTGQLTPFGGESARHSRLLKGPVFFETLTKRL